MPALVVEASIRTGSVTVSMGKLLLISIRLMLVGLIGPGATGCTCTGENVSHEDPRPPAVKVPAKIVDLNAEVTDLNQYHPPTRRIQ